MVLLHRIVRKMTFNNGSTMESFAIDTSRPSQSESFRFLAIFEGFVLEFRVKMNYFPSLQ